jgi:hypothetical protein
MRGQPWLELELHGRLWKCSLERGETGKERVRGGAQLRARQGLAMGGCRRGAQPVAPLFGLFSGRSREEENSREEREEKREKRKE